MSQENIEIVRRIYELLNRGDVEGVVALSDDDLAMDMSERGFNPRYPHRTDGRLAWLRSGLV
jgi:ketosteroid isomerase-like protein